jgi:Tol biopolymer transport system component
LYIMPTLGGQARKVADGAAHGSWSPDGRRIVYTPSFDSVVVMDIDGPARTTLATGRELHSPAWSQDGKWVAYVEGNTRFHSDGNNASSTVWLVPAAGGTAVNATGSASLNTSPVWIPGRRALLFISDRDSGRDIYQLAITRSGRPAGAPVRITTGLNPERLSISADGRWIAWSVLTIVSNVWSIDVPARDSVPFSAARPVTTGTQNVEGVSVSSDGAWLYFDSDRSGNADVWRLRLAGGEPEQLTTDPLGDFAPEPSPDGRYVAFHSLRNGTTNRDIFVMSADGGRAAQVSAGPGDDRDAHWSPDGRALAWLDRFSSDSAILVARRHDDGSWSAPRRYASPPNTGSVIWSDANVVEFFAAPGFFHLDTRTGGITRLVAGWQGPGHARSADGRVIYALVGDRIAALRLPDTTWNTLVYSDSAARRGIRGFALRGGKFYIPSPEPQMDVWVAELSSP